MNPSDERLEWIQRYADGLASADETARLEAALREDADLRASFLEYLNVDEALESITAAHAAAPLEATKAYSWRWAAVVIATAAMLCLWLATREPTPAVLPVMVEVVAVRGATDRDTPHFSPGQRLSLHEIRLPTGALELQLDAGIKLEFIGPAEAKFEGPMRLNLLSGQLNADVGEQGKGFTVVTNAGEVVDLGTRFGVEVDHGGPTNVVVFEGAVQVRANEEAASATKAWTSLSTGDAVRMSGGRRDMQRMSRIQFSSHAHDWSMAEPEAGGIVGDVRDNVTDAQFRRYFGIVPQGMGDGAQPFSDQPSRRLRAVPGEPFPAFLVGTDLVRTFSADRHDADLEITLDLRRACTVYILLDVRRQPLPWLFEHFTDTGARLQVGPWGATNIADGLPLDDRGEQFVTCAVWKHEVLVPGKVLLGPPHQARYRGQHPMYALAVGPLPSKKP